MIVDVMKHAHYKRRPRYEVSFLVWRAAGLFYHGFFTDLGGFTQYCADLCDVCDNLCLLWRCRG